MLKIQEIRELIKLIDDSSISEFKYEQNGAKVQLRKNSASGGTVQIPQPEQSPPEAPAEPPSAPVQQEVKPAAEEEKPQKEISDSENLHKISSPMVGTFYSSPSPDADPYVKKGDKVKNESVVCIVEAMKLMNEIEAEIDGEIVEVLAENGQLVEYGQELFLVKPE
ncbi:acetyl-CoA carboxylase biotin carboxyl carrier protein [Alkalicoccus saliphilus]|uniref:Biotin carboxyl carrier protein of acetyl-CoA carboxylase n=1 Tax=Alkalicoccus saliphilus TaxID=200989 RepID=A0A2T4UAQ0_9BACI|nr:acetyl-CoA carboxylase biotin carboxyl carrier protein [Alkalicoccus saliphilus]PTL40473.1 acetyl-CoA carboxylase biotin carboxyl carrier protein [Alkalicoccus saliphilus]